MQVSVEPGEGLERRLIVELPSEAIDHEVEKRLRDYARTARLPGFRPGKVPMRLLRQRYRDSLGAEVFGEQLETSYPQAIAQAGLRPAGRPRIEPNLDRENGRYSYTATLEVLPELDPAPLDGRSLKRPIAEVVDADIDALIERLREQRKSWQAVERPAAQGDRVNIAYRGTVDGEPFDGGSADDARVEIGASTLVPGFEDQLVGVVAGEERMIDVTFPADYHAESLAGKSARFAVQVKAVEEAVLPDVDAQFVAAFGIDDGDLDRFRADVRKNMERELGERIKATVKQNAMDLLLEANPIELPGALVVEEIAAMRRQMGQRLGLDKEIDLPDEVFADQARRRVALGLIVAEIVKRNELKADAERVRAAVEAMAATYEEPQSVIDYYYADPTRLAGVESVVLEDRVVEHILGQADVIDEPTTFSALTDNG